MKCIITYTYPDGEKHTYIFTDEAKATEKILSILQQAMGNDIKLTIKTTIQ